jgi:cytochrome oxidase assembly protein ShyY1
MFSRQWWLFTLIVLAAIVVCVQAGFWQMERRQFKHQLNLQMAQKWDMPRFNLNQETLPADLTTLEYRRVEVRGAFDYANQIVLKNDVRGDAPGVNLVTPLVLDDQQAILVARGWIPLAKAAPEFWPEFEEIAGQVVVGLIKESQTLAGATQPQEAQREWFRIDIEAIQPQMPYPLLPAFLAMLPEPGRTEGALPIRTPPPAPYDELMHVNYTVQWFIFALIFGFGYLQYLTYDERRRARPASQTERMLSQAGVSEEAAPLS